MNFRSGFDLRRRRTHRVHIKSRLATFRATRSAGSGKERLSAARPLQTHRQLRRNRLLRWPQGTDSVKPSETLYLRHVSYFRSSCRIYAPRIVI